MWAGHRPPPPPGISPPPQWGDSQIVRERFGQSVKDILFERETLLAPALSPQHYRTLMERTAGPLRKLVESLTNSDPAKLTAYRHECEALAAEYFENNAVRQGYLITRA